MELNQNLQKLGLNEKQTKVYLACLQLGVDSVANIARYADLKRPTVYLILDDLEKMNLISKIKKEKKSLFKAEEPKRILTDLKFKQELANDLLPSLEAIYNLNPDKPNIKIGEGMAGVRSAYNGVFTYLENHPQDELLIFGSLKDAKEHFEAQVIDSFYRSMARSQNSVREIGNDDHETRKYYRASAKLNPRHEIRLIRNEGLFNQTDNMLYGNTLIIFSVKEQLFATTVESANITETYRTLFNMAWRAGKRI
jgi:sugar-specific transcriptional regulator TrmB